MGMMQAHQERSFYLVWNIVQYQIKILRLNQVVFIAFLHIVQKDVLGNDVQEAALFLEGIYN